MDEALLQNVLVRFELVYRESVLSTLRFFSVVINFVL